MQDTKFNVIAFFILADKSIPDQVKQSKFYITKLEEQKSLSDWLVNMLSKALEDHGIGAKTAVGYGSLKAN